MREHADGRQIALATFGPGDIFGELAMFDDERRSATVETIDAARGARDPRPGHAPADAAPPAARGRAGRARSRAGCATTNERLASQSFQTVQIRVASVIAQLVEQARAEGAPDTDVPITATQADLAMLAGSSRESASRFLATLERAGVISQGRGRLTVHDPDALRNYVY